MCVYGKVCIIVPDISSRCMVLTPRILCVRACVLGLYRRPLAYYRSGNQFCVCVCVFNSTEFYFPNLITSKSQITSNGRSTPLLTYKYQYHNIKIIHYKFDGSYDWYMVIYYLKLLILKQQCVSSIVLSLCEVELIWTAICTVKGSFVQCDQVPAKCLIDLRVTVN